MKKSLKYAFDLSKSTRVTTIDVNIRCILIFHDMMQSTSIEFIDLQVPIEEILKFVRFHKGRRIALILLG